ncbi:hypothetical protein RQP46_000181 [Phenoliferia psychrophenolica]
MSSNGGRRRGPRTPSVAWRPGPIRKLATETLLTILEMASFDSEHNLFECREVETLDARTAGHLSRVSHEWRQLAITLRLRIITIDPTSPSTHKILDLFILHPHLAKHVRSLTIARRNEGFAGGSATDGVPWISTDAPPNDPSFSWKTTLAWAATLPNLQHLHISHPSCENESIAAEDEWQNASWTSFPILSGAFANVEIFYGAFESDLSMAWWLLTGMASLKWLWLQSAGVALYGTATPTPLPSLLSHYPHLELLLLDGIEMDPSQFQQLISPMTSLVALGVRSTPTLSPADLAFAVSHCPELWELIWDGTKYHAMSTLLEAIGHSHIAQLSLRPWILTDELARALPPSLRALSLMESQHIPSLVAALPQLPLLQCVTYTGTTLEMAKYWREQRGESHPAALPEHIEVKHEPSLWGTEWQDDW